MSAEFTLSKRGVPLEVQFRYGLVGLFAGLLASFSGLLLVLTAIGLVMPALNAKLVGKALPALDAQEVIDFCRANMAGYKIPRTVVFGALPKTSTGKIQKFVLRSTLQ